MNDQRRSLRLLHQHYACLILSPNLLLKAVVGVGSSTHWAAKVRHENPFQLKKGKPDFEVVPTCLYRQRETIKRRDNLESLTLNSVLFLRPPTKIFFIYGSNRKHGALLCRCQLRF